MLFLLFLTITSVIIALRIEPVQKKICGYISEELTTLLKHKTTVERFEIDWFDHFVVRKIVMKDVRDSNMIWVDEAWVDFKIFHFDKKGLLKFQLQEVVLRDGGVHLIKHKNLENMNMTYFVDAVQSLSDPKDTSKADPFDVGKVKLINMTFLFDDYKEPYLKKGFDHFHFSFTKIYGITENLHVYDGLFSIDLYKLKTIEGKTGLPVHSLSGTYTYAPTYMELKNMDADIGNSHLTNYLKMSYDDILDMKDFNDKTHIEAELDGCKLDMHDIIPFAEQVEAVPMTFYFSGHVHGKVSRFQAKNFQVSLGKQSYINGNYSLIGLPDFFNTFIEADIKKFNLITAELPQNMNNEILKVAKRMKYISGKSKFTGLPKDFVAYGSFNSGIGKFNTDIKMHFDDEDFENQSTYEGHLQTQQFNLGTLIKSTKLGVINMKGKVKGVGFEPNSFELDLNSDIYSLQFNDYTYRNITTDATISNGKFNGEGSINDSNLVATFDGQLDFSDDVKILNADADIKHSNLGPLNFDLMDKNAFLKSKINLQFKGSTIDDAVGNGYITKTYLVYNDNKELFIDTLHLKVDQNGDQKSIRIDSDIFDFTVDGNYKPTELIDDFITHNTEVAYRLFADSLDEIKYYNNKTKSNINPYNATYALKIKNINDLLNIYAPGLHISSESSINGTFASNEKTTSKIKVHFDTVYYKNFQFIKNDLKVFTNKFTNQPNVIGNISLSSEQQNHHKFASSEKLILESILIEDQVNFYISANQKETDNYTRLSGSIMLYEPYRILRLNNSYLNIASKRWEFSDESLARFNKDEFISDNVSISYRDESIFLNGKATKDDTKGFISLNNVQLVDFYKFFSTVPLEGKTNGIINIGSSTFNSNIEIQDFKVDSVYIGNLDGKAQWKDNIEINLDVIRNSSKTFNLKGYIEPSKKDTPEKIFLDAAFNRTNIEILNKLMSGVLTEIEGEATGSLKIRGSFEEPLITGEAFVKNGAFKIPFLGTKYHFSDVIKLDHSRIGFDHMDLMDVNNNVCHVEGGITHSNYTNYIMDLRGEIPTKANTLGFQAVNRPEKGSDLFYGEAYVFGDFSLLGPANKIAIQANLSNTKNTNIYIPLTSNNTVTKNDYITFYEDDKSKSMDVDVKKKVDVSGISMDLNLNINNEAYSEIIFDKKAGDIIRGRGMGNLKLTIDTRGEFNMFGNYTILDGKYNFTMAGLINKEFNIRQGSKITWTGDPYEGLLDVNTTYVVQSPLSPIITDSSRAKSADALRRYPVDVNMHLGGILKSPEIGLGVQIQKKYPGQFTGDVTQFESYIASNPSELNKQVFSLIVLGKLSPYGSFTGIGGSYSNLSELISYQLSNFLSQVDENLEVSINLNNLDKNGLNTLNMRLSYTAMDGRLRISRDGGYHYSNGTNTATNIVGEWTVEYVLTPSGNLRVKVYNKINQNALITSTNSYTTMSTGFSIMNTQDFDNLGDLFKRKKPKKIKEKKRK